MIIYRLRVTLLPSSPLFTGTEDVWRDVEVDETYTLETLHETIFEAFDRHDRHLYEFTTPNVYGQPERTYVDPHSDDDSPSWREKGSAEIERLLDQIAPDDTAEEAKESFREAHANPPPEGNAAETTIADLDLAEGDAMQYLFDYGDTWDHEIEVREVREGTLDGPPTVVDDHGDAPPQYPDPDEL